MQRIMFNDRYGLTQAVLEGRKTMTRRTICKSDHDEVFDNSVDRFNKGWIDHEIPTPNFENWIKGCPRHDEEWFTEMERLRKQVRLARERLEECIDKNAK